MSDLLLDLRYAVRAPPRLAIEPFTATVGRSVGQPWFTIVALGLSAGLAIALALGGAHGWRPSSSRRRSDWRWCCRRPQRSFRSSAGSVP